MRTIKLPISFQNGRLATISDINQIIKQKIIDVLVTSKNERVMIPEYGSGAYSLLYESMDPTVFADFRADALQELAVNVTGATILDVVLAEGISLGSGDYNTTLTINVVYQIPPYPITSTTFSISDVLTEDSFL